MVSGPGMPGMTRSLSPGSPMPPEGAAEGESGAACGGSSWMLSPSALPKRSSSRCPVAVAAFCSTSLRRPSPFTVPVNTRRVPSPSSDARGTTVRFSRTVPVPRASVPLPLTANSSPRGVTVRLPR